jgi:hypothetical protein
MDGDYCQECSWQTWRIRFPGPNGICVWDVCTTCGMWYRVME